MKRTIIFLFLIILPFSIIVSQEDLYGFSGMPWNTTPQKVISEMKHPDIIMLDTNRVVWLNRDYYSDQYEQFALRFEIDTSKKINDIINEYNNFQFVYNETSMGLITARMSIHFINGFAFLEKYDVYIDNISINERHRLYEILRNQFIREYGTPNNTIGRGVLYSTRWEKYYTNIKLELLNIDIIGYYLTISYERSEISRRQENLGFNIYTDIIVNNIRTYEQFMSIIEEFKNLYKESGIDVGDIVPNAMESDPMTIGVNHILNTTNYNSNELWCTRLYYENIETWIFVYIWFTTTSVNGYFFRGIILPNSGFSIN